MRLLAAAHPRPLESDCVSKDDAELTAPWEKALEEDNGDLKKLLPPMPDDYFDGKTDIWKDAIPYEMYRGAAVKPYFRVKDLNNSPDSTEENRRVPAFEAGIKVSF